MKKIVLFINIFALLSLMLACNQVENSNEKLGALQMFNEPVREEGQKDVIELRCEPIDTVRMAIIGLGMRGSGAVYRYNFIEGAKIVALCDVVPENVEKAQEMLVKSGKPKADEYTDSLAWKEICERDDIDLIYVCTHWDLHTPIAVYAMEHGKHVALEVPAALTIDECWQLVNSA